MQRHLPWLFFFLITLDTCSSLAGTIHVTRKSPCIVHAIPSGNNDDLDSSTKPRVSFSKQRTAVVPSNFIDRTLSWISSDVGSIILGLSGLILLLVGRALLDDENVWIENAGQATRTNLVAVFATGAVLLNGLSKLDVESTLSPLVELSGTSLPEVVMFEEENNELKWMMESILVATPAVTIVLLQEDGNSSWKVKAKGGIVPYRDDRTLEHATIILNNAWKGGTIVETYLPTLQALPGRTEFSYLPPETQAVVIFPVDAKTRLVLGSNQAKSFTPRDLAWCLVLVTRYAAIGSLE